jgi:hypothetical protein
MSTGIRFISGPLSFCTSLRFALLALTKHSAGY